MHLLKWNNPIDQRTWIDEITELVVDVIDDNDEDIGDTLHRSTINSKEKIDDDKKKIILLFSD